MALSVVMLMLLVVVMVGTVQGQGELCVEELLTV